MCRPLARRSAPSVYRFFKGGGSTVAKVVAGAGFAAEFVRACNETTGGNNQNSSGEKQSSGNSVTTISQGTTTSNSPSNSTTNSTFTMPVYTLPSDNTRVVTPIIPLKKNKNLLYVIGIIILIIKIFFREDIPKELDVITGYLLGVFLLVIIVLEVLTKRK